MDDVAQSNKEIGLQLLELSAGIEGFVFVGGRREKVAAGALLQRVRRFARYAYMLVGREGALEAAVLLRSMTEYVLTLRWIGIDPELTCRLWLLADTKSTITQDADYLKETGAGLLHPEVRAQREAERDLLDREIDALPNLAERLVDIGGRTKPNLRDIARLTDTSVLYELGYRLDSRIAAHPTMLAVEQLLEPSPEGGLRVCAEPQRKLPEPYGIGAALLGSALLTVADQVPELALDTDEIERLAGDLRLPPSPDGFGL